MIKKENILLVECNTGSNHRPNLALSRYSTLFKSQGHNVLHAILDSKYKLPFGYMPDRVYISAVFSWHLPRLLKFVNLLKFMYPKLSEKGRIQLGGVCTTHMEEYIKETFELEPIKGCNYELDLITPDSSFFTNDTSYIFTSRGCPNSCSYCAVKHIEPTQYVIPNWKEQINEMAKYLVICDNNPLRTNMEHRKDLFDYLRAIASKEGTRVAGTRKLREVEFDSGLDWRSLTEENLELMQGIKYSTIKLAWDDVRHEAQFDEAVGRLIKAFPEENKRGLMACYLLYNCPDTKDTVESILYRAYKIFRKYQIYPYAMRYQPLDSLEHKKYLSPHWNANDCTDVGRWLNSRTLFKSVQRYLYYYGRKEDGTCFDKCNSDQLKAIQEINQIKQYNIPFQLDFAKSFNENLRYLSEEMKVRNEMVTKIHEKLRHVQLSLDIA